VELSSRFLPPCIFILAKSPPRLALRPIISAKVKGRTAKPSPQPAKKNALEPALLKELTAATEACRKALGKDPENAALLARLGNILLKQGNFKEAMEMFSQAIALRPDFRAAYTNLSALQWGAGKFTQARASLEQGIRKAPYIAPSPTKEKQQRILRLRGIENGAFILGQSRNGQYKSKLRGGNFTDKYLIDKSRYVATDFLVLGDNLLQCDSIPNFKLILNATADPDLETPSLQVIAEFLRRNDTIAVINRPEHIALTSRDENFRRLDPIDGISFPKTVRCGKEHLRESGSKAFLEENALSFPLIVRRTGTQTGQTTAKAENRQGLKEYAELVEGEEFYVIQYVKNPFSEKYFRKMRVFFVDGHIYPVVCHIDDVWNVHGDNRKELMKKNKWMREEEEAFVTDCRSYMGKEAFAVLQGLHEVIKLDFFGVDFTIMEDGAILIFELNAVMRHHFDHSEHFPYLIPSLQNITNAFNKMLEDKILASQKPES
jgi:tetratricopeptide (TPR) repeat protein